MFKIIPFECTSIILYLETFAPDGKEKSLAVFGFSIISMILIILPFAVRPYSQMKAYRKAYLKIDSLVYLFIAKWDQSDKENQKMKLAFARVIKIGENYINHAIDIDNPADDILCSDAKKTKKENYCFSFFQQSWNSGIKESRKSRKISKGL